MNPLQQDFDRLRCAGTPWCLILTPDYRECMRSLCKMQAEQEEPPSLWAWDCLQGHRCLSEASLTSILGSPDERIREQIAGKGRHESLPNGWPQVSSPERWSGVLRGAAARAVPQGTGANAVP